MDFFFMCSIFTKLSPVDEMKNTKYICLSICSILVWPEKFSFRLKFPVMEFSSYLASKLSTIISLLKTLSRSLIIKIDLHFVTPNCKVFFSCYQIYKYILLLRYPYDIIYQSQKCQTCQELFRQVGLKGWRITHTIHTLIKPFVGLQIPSRFPSLKDKTLVYCQPQAKAKAKAMPGRLYIHTK